MNKNRRFKFYLVLLAIIVLINLKGVFLPTTSIEQSLYGITIYSLALASIVLTIEGPIFICKMVNKLINKIRN